VADCSAQQTSFQLAASDGQDRQFMLNVGFTS
jgi:hypothetical protein